MSIAEIVDDLYETSAVSSELPHRCTPAMSTPAAKTSELRASACDVSTPPYDKSPDADARRIDVGPRLQVLARGDHVAYSALPRPPVFGAVRNDFP